MRNKIKKHDGSKLLSIEENGESGECYKPLTDEVLRARKLNIFKHHQPAEQCFGSLAMDEAAERLHSLHFGLHHKFDYYEASNVEDGAILT
ncbi:unnamed protein product [Linum trigynum]|uniref:Uncharacterized protein n=1 Tax=Linum trigynum TaxID=586398 RepID=A0AAV2GRD1_9ROSI